MRKYNKMTMWQVARRGYRSWSWPPYNGDKLTTEHVQITVNKNKITS